MTPFFSIVIPLYNKEKYIVNTLKSVLEQTFQEFEIIIVNDGSTDNGTAEVVKLEDDRIKLFNIENQGVSNARNYGISKSNSNFIAFLDADDFWFPNHLEDLKKLIETCPDCGLYATGYESVFFDHSVFKAKFLDLNADFIGIVDDYFHHSLINQLAWTSAVAIPSKILNTYGSFDIALRTGEDTDLWTRIALQEKVAFNSKISAQKIMTSSPHHLSKSTYILDKVNLLKKFKSHETTKPSFKTYMDYNRYSIAVERKMAGDIKNFDIIRKDIDLNELNTKQKLLLKLPGSLLKLLKRVQNSLLKRNIYLSAFR